MKSLKSFALVAIGSLLIGASSLLACQMSVDVHPTSCPNPINVGSKGLVPAAMVGSETRDVYDINTADARGIQMVYPPYYTPNQIIVKAVKSAYEDVVSPFEGELECGNEYACTENGADGYMDLTLKFPMQGKTDKSGVYHPGVADILEGLENGDTRCVEINGWTYSGMRYHGQDVVIVKGVKKAKK